MSGSMDCRRLEELLSDLHEKILDPVLRAEVEAHLATCPACLELREALGQVVAALRGYPELAPPGGLAERAATAALTRRIGSQPLPLARREMAARLAAALALLLTGAALLASGPEGAPARTARRLVDRTGNAGAFLLEKKDRLVEDFRILRVVIATAFEGRLDRVNDRVEDYRRLIERRQTSGEYEKKSRLFPNNDVKELVTTSRDVKMEDETT